MKFCENCGKELKDGYDFCPNCGKIIKFNKTGSNKVNKSKLKTSVIIGISVPLFVILTVTLFIFKLNNQKYVSNSDDKCEIIFIVNGERINTLYINKGDLLPEPETPTKENYVFSHWATHEKSTDGSEIFDFSKPVNKSWMLFAHFKPISQNNKPEYAVNVPFRFDGLEITISDNFSFTSIDNLFSDLNGHDVIKIPVTIKNVSSQNKSLNLFYTHYFGTSRVELEDVSSYFISEECVEFAGELLPEASYTKYFYFLYDGNGEYIINFKNFDQNISIKISIVK